MSAGSVILGRGSMPTASVAGGPRKEARWDGGAVAVLAGEGGIRGGVGGDACTHERFCRMPASPMEESKGLGLARSVGSQ